MVKKGHKKGNKKDEAWDDEPDNPAPNLTPTTEDAKVTIDPAAKQDNSDEKPADSWIDAANTESKPDDTLPQESIGDGATEAKTCDIDEKPEMEVMNGCKKEESIDQNKPDVEVNDNSKEKFADENSATEPNPFDVEEKLDMEAEGDCKEKSDTADIAAEIEACDSEKVETKENCEEKEIVDQPKLSESGDVDKSSKKKHGKKDKQSKKSDKHSGVATESQKHVAPPVKFSDKDDKQPDVVIEAAEHVVDSPHVELDDLADKTATVKIWDVESKIPTSTSDNAEGTIDSAAKLDDTPTASSIGAEKNVSKPAVGDTSPQKSIDDDITTETKACVSEKKLGADSKDDRKEKESMDQSKPSDSGDIDKSGKKKHSKNGSEKQAKKGDKHSEIASEAQKPVAPQAKFSDEGDKQPKIVAEVDKHAADSPHVKFANVGDKGAATAGTGDVYPSGDLKSIEDVERFKANLSRVLSKTPVKGAREWDDKNMTMVRSQLRQRGNVKELLSKFESLSEISESPVVGVTSPKKAPVSRKWSSDKPAMKPFTPPRSNSPECKQEDHSPKRR